VLEQAVRRFTISTIRSSHYAEGPGKNLPMGNTNGEMVEFFGSGLAFPFITDRHQILKK
uniref:Cytochrome c oxidase subunit 7C, mitochondrial n=1 Tax=Oryzias melastigma TaxID=30732 RepID=A0A3B3C3R7_ORYME